MCTMGVRLTHTHTRPFTWGRRGLLECLVVQTQWGRAEDRAKCPLFVVLSRVHWRLLWWRGAQRRVKVRVLHHQTKGRCHSRWRWRVQRWYVVALRYPVLRCRGSLAGVQQYGWGPEPLLRVLGGGQRLRTGLGQVPLLLVRQRDEILRRRGEERVVLLQRVPLLVKQLLQLWQQIQILSQGSELAHRVRRGSRRDNCHLVGLTRECESGQL